MNISSSRRQRTRLALVFVAFSSALASANVAEFTPTGNGIWNDASSWSTVGVPNGAGAAVRIPAPSPDNNRTITLNAPVTVGTLHFNLLNSGSRTRLQDTGAGHRLTFEDPSGTALLRVTGTGVGFAETQFEAPVVLSSNLELRVDTIVGDQEHGGLRLRTDWEGPGGLIKTGLGIATLTGGDKRFTGAVVIEEGVLRVTEPATPRQSSDVRVEPGGQLRLVSGSGGNDLRVYSFGGNISLNSQGRGSEIPDGSQEGVWGALRYDPGVNDNRAILTNDLILSGPSSLHVDGTRNQLELTGRIQGSAGFSKSGGGILILNNVLNTSYHQPIQISNSVIEVRHGVGSPIELSEEGVLTGWGSTGALSGNGTVVLDKTLMDSPRSEGLRFAFVIGRNGMPEMSQPSASQNGVLRLHEAPSQIQAIDFYLDGPDLSASVDAYGGFLVPESVDLQSAILGVPVRFFVPDSNGTHSFAERNWNLTSGVSIASSSIQADLGSGPTSAKILRISQQPGSFNYTAWRNAQFSDPADRANEAVSGPMATPRDDGIRNLERYAYGIPWEGDPSPYLPEIEATGSDLRIHFILRPNLLDLRYRVVRSNNLENWETVLFDSDLDGKADLDANSRKTIVDTNPPTAEARFYRVVPELQ